VKVQPMPFRAPHVSFVSFAVEVQSSGVTQVMIVETDLHLNPRHPAYDRLAVTQLIAASEAYTSANVEGPSSIRLISTRNGGSSGVSFSHDVSRSTEAGGRPIRVCESRRSPVRRRKARTKQDEAKLLEMGAAGALEAIVESPDRTKMSVEVRAAEIKRRGAGTTREPEAG